LEEVESDLLDGLRLWLASYKINLEISASGANINTGKAAAEQIKASIDTIKKQISALYDLLERGIYATDVFLERHKILEEKLKTAEYELETANKQSETANRISKSQRDIIPKIENALDVYAGLESAREKNNLLKEVLNKVLYSKTKGTRWEESNMHLDIYPKID
jgi:septation ring formation regulator EzrA